MSTTEAPPATLRVVIVEDSPDVRFLLVATLEMEEGIAVVGEAGRARHALELVARTQPDVVVLDLDLPGRNGLWLLPRLAQAAPRVRTVVVSGDLRPDVREKAMAAGAAALVSKADAHASLAPTIAAIAGR